MKNKYDKNFYLIELPSKLTALIYVSEILF